MKRVAGLCAAVVLAAGVLAVGQQQFPEPRKQFGAGVTGAFEGWFENPDGARGFLVGYYNRNTEQKLDIPIGPNNQIEPGGPDMGQPTHFLPGRRYGVFSVPVPKTFKPEDRYNWTLVANGQTTTIPLRLHPEYVLDPFTEAAVHNTPPVVRLEQNGRAFQGPTASLATALARTTSASSPLRLNVWVTDDMKYTTGASTPLSGQPPPVTLRWVKYRGAGTITIDRLTPEVKKVETPGQGAAFSGTAATSVTFSQPGDYMLQLTANDYSGEGGASSGVSGCCWTTALVKVTVTP